MGSRSIQKFVGTSALALLMLAVFSGCDRNDRSGSDGGGASGASAASAQPANQLDLLFVYGSEKKAWIDDVTSDFNQGGHKLPDGRTIHVTATPMGSGETIDGIISGATPAHLVSPASMAFIALGNARWRAKTNADLIVPTHSAGNFDNLVLSPVVLAMWKPMAEALGWPARRIGWGEVLALAKDPQGWASRGHPEWGAFKFGHTHPEYSNSGLIAVLAEAYAGAGKTRGLAAEDLANPRIGAYVQDIEQAVVHYGSSTGFFADRMMAGGPSYLSAAVLYESLVIDSYHRSPPTEFPVVAVYPKEGTFWSDHPIGIVQREWVKDEHRAAARAYSEFLRAEPQQRKALQYGFRPGDTNIPMGPPFDASFGVDPAEPRTILELPRAEVVDAAIDLWRHHKKHANVVIVFDTSGSMAEEQKMPGAREGAAKLIAMLDDQDMLSLLPFNDELHWTGQGIPLATARESALRTVNGLMPGGGTALYNAIAAAHQYILSQSAPDRISAIVVLTDGEDTAGRMTFDQLRAQLRAANERGGVRVFTIGYGSDARGDVLKSISDDTHGKYFQGTPQNIREVFREIATFF